MTDNLIKFIESGKTIMKDCFTNHLPGSPEQHSFDSDSESYLLNRFDTLSTINQVHELANEFSDHIVYPFPKICNENFVQLAAEIQSTIDNGIL